MPRSQDLATWLPILNLKHPLTKIMEFTSSPALCDTPQYRLDSKGEEHGVRLTQPAPPQDVTKSSLCRHQTQALAKQPSNLNFRAKFSSGKRRSFPSDRNGKRNAARTTFPWPCQLDPFLIPTSSRIVPSASYA
ncbi:hypothetical protein NLI96_g1840 [Meripilus lineatus]|uniref:Uncharacterized protein n=1 Tax=Meripilus lineatus TaxID=2056292 RepID=A0AAD5YH43_9APHY|nr:hypothetical protein NLI96_g1840 [Physisporinus lineatus]